MTNLEALIAELEPYTVSSNTALRSLEKAGLVYSATATATDTTNETALATATVDCLSKLLVLGGESEGGFSQSYTDALKRRIRQICDLYGLDVTALTLNPSVDNASNRW